jgi:hypothetical protein
MIVLFVAQYLNAKNAEDRKDFSKEIRIFLCEPLRFFAAFAFKKTLFESDVQQ